MTDPTSIESPTDTTRPKRGTIAALTAVGAVLGLATAMLLVTVMFPSIAPATSSENVVDSANAQPGTDSPSADAEASDGTPEDDQPDLPDGMSPTYVPPGSSGSGPTNSNSGSTGGSTSGSTGGSTNSGGGSTGGSTGGGGTPAPDPELTDCPNTRSENPALYDACRAGYVRPSVAFQRVVSCQVVDRAAGHYRLTYQLALSGGNYRHAEFVGLTDNARGIVTTNVLDVSREYFDSRESLPLGWSAEVWVDSMNGLRGLIDRVYAGGDFNVVLADYC